MKSVDRFTVSIPGGPVLSGELQKLDWKGGRRLIFRDGDAVVFDSGECVSLAIAVQLADVWLLERIATVIESSRATGELQTVKGD